MPLFILILLGSILHALSDLLLSTFFCIFVEGLLRGGTGGYGYYVVQAEKGAEAHSEVETRSVVTMRIGTKEWLKRVLDLIHRIENLGK